MPSNLQILFARQHPHHPITLNPKNPSRPHSTLLPHPLVAMLSNPPRKHQRIQPTQHTRIPRHRLRHRSIKHLQRQHRRSIALPRSALSISRISPPTTRQSLQPRRMIQHRLHLIRAHPLRPHQIQCHSRIKIPTPSPHHHTTRRRHPHTRIHRTPRHAIAATLHPFPRCATTIRFGRSSFTCCTIDSYESP